MYKALYYPLHQRSDGELELIYKNRGFLYGDGFFETLRFHHGQMLFFDDHYNRIKDSFAKLHFSTLPDREKLYAELMDAAAATGSHQARIRITFFRAGNGYYTPDSGEAAAVVTAHPLDAFYEFSKPGFSCCIYKEGFKSSTVLQGIKSLNSAVSILAGIYARNNHFDEALVLNEKQLVTDSVSSNVFVVTDEVIVTPPVSEGCINGIMRKQVIDFCKRAGLTCQEKSISVDDVLSASEVFLTNVIAGIRSVSTLNDSKYEMKMSRHIYSGLLQKL